MSPTNSALVCCPDASVPAFGSVRPKAPSFLPESRSGRYFFFCSSLPQLKIGQQQSEVCAEQITPVEAQTLDSSSTVIAYEMWSPPAPPYSTGNGTPSIPYLAIFSTVSTGNLCSLSMSAANGSTSLVANSLTIFLTNSCSFVS